MQYTVRVVVVGLLFRAYLSFQEKPGFICFERFSDGTCSGIPSAVLASVEPCCFLNQSGGIIISERGFVESGNETCLSCNALEPLVLNCTTDPDVLTVMVTCTASNSVCDVYCSYDGGPTMPCELVNNLAIRDFSPGDHSLDITIIDMYGLVASHPTLTFTRPALLEVQCSVHDSLTIDCTNSTVVESQICSIDDGFHFDCSLPRDIDELATTYNLTAGDHKLFVKTVDVFGQSDTTLVTFTLFPLVLNCTTDPDMLTVMVTCTASNSVSDVICSYNGGPAVPCELVDNLPIGDFPPGNHTLDITVIDVYGQSVTHPTLTFTRPALLEVQCSVHDSLTIDCTSSTVVESQMCSIDDGSWFDCSLPRDINELATTYNLTLGDHNLTVITVDEFGQSNTTLLTFTLLNFFSPTFGDSSALSSGTKAAVAISVITLVILLMTVIVMGAVIRRRKKKERAGNQIKNFTEVENTETPTETFTELQSTEYKMEELIAEYLNEYQQSNGVQELKLELSYKKMIYSKNCIELSAVVGQGESGLVYCGYLDSGGVRDIVAIKTCKALSLASNHQKLLKEVTSMLSFSHPNVMTLIGVCFDGDMPLIIMPYMSNGSVLRCVKEKRKELHFDKQANQQEVGAARKLCLDMLYQISNGMQYLAKHRFVHRDLAARNCMINHRGVIKVADFGLTEDMYARNYFRHDKSEEGCEEKVPIRWMAPESIQNDIYNEKTDVWAFGVTCWEVFTCGGVPYAGVPAMSLLSQLHNGHRLDRPRNATCSDQIWDMMMSCWSEHTQQRPGFTRLVEELFDMLDSDSTYLKLNLPMPGSFV